MKHAKSWCNLFLLIILAAFPLTGCGSSTTDKNANDQEPGHVVPTITPALTGDPSLFPNAHLLASVQDLLETNSEGNTISTVKTDSIIIDTRAADAYAAAHIPGAIHMEWSSFSLMDQPRAKGILKPVADLTEQLGALGLTRDASIVVYDDTTVSWGSAGRIFWMLELLGCTNIRLLNGGWDKWTADNLPTETAPNVLAPAEFTAQINPAVNSDKEHIRNRLQDADFVTIDTRNDEEYIGWTLYGEARGGHIPGAVHLPYAWYYHTDKSILGYADLKKLLETHGITAEKEVVAYCTAGVRSGFFYFLGRLMGYERVANYDGSMWDWAAADTASYAMEKPVNYQKLVHPGWVKDLMDGKAVQNPPAGRYVVVAAGYHPPPDPSAPAPEAGDGDVYIPGSFYLHRDEIELNPRNNTFGAGNLWDDETLKTNIQNMGIDKDTTVILYPHNPGNPDPIFATRVLWALMYAGVADARLINGGIDAWMAKGYEVVSTPADRPAPVDFGTGPGEFPLHPEYLATTAYVETVVNGDHPEAVIGDLRSWGEYVGSGNDYRTIGIPLDATGRIPGARWAHWGPTTLLGGHFWDADGTLRSYTEVEQFWKDWGITGDKTVSFYCGTAWRSTLGFFYGHLMGWEGIKNYDGSWFEWTQLHPNAANHPVSRGINPDWDTNNYQHIDRLVDARWVKEYLIDLNNGGKPYVIVETGWGAAGEDYNSGHIPGAIWVNTDEIEYDCFNPRNDWPVEAGDPACWDRSTTAEEDAAKGLGPNDGLPRNWWNIYPDEYLLSAIAHMGIDKNTTVVVSGDPAGAAPRILWTLMYAGVEDVRLLDGGDDAWTDAGYELETTANTRTPVDSFDPDNPGRITAIHPEYKVDIPYVRDAVAGANTDAMIVDIRSADEYSGRSAPYSYIPTDGRIPGAVWGKAGSDPWNMEDYVNTDNTLKSPVDIAALWTAQGITPDRHLSFYCGTGWRASLPWFFGYMMGYSNISNFDSGWFEWSMGEGSAYNEDDPVRNPIVDDHPALP